MNRHLLYGQWKENTLTFEIPGYGPEDVKVEIVTDHNGPSLKLFLRGAEYTAFWPEQLSEEVSATVKNGVLAITGKVEKPKRMVVKVN